MGPAVSDTSTQRSPGDLFPPGLRHACSIYRIRRPKAVSGESCGWPVDGALHPADRHATGRPTSRRRQGRVLESDVIGRVARGAHLRDIETGDLGLGRGTHGHDLVEDLEEHVA